ncbi:Cytoplasmic dynein 2 heavy chain 1, partial [Blyttiomyces sp. JEL0837]
MTDTVVDWVQKLVGLHLGIHDQHVIHSLGESSQLQSFLNDSSGNALSLFVSWNQDDGFHMATEHDMKSSSNTEAQLRERTIAITKSRPAAALDPSDLNVTLVSQSPANSLYQVIHGVFAPLTANTKLMANEKLRNLITDLDNGLCMEISSGDAEGNAVVAKIEDELKYWEKRISSKQGKDRERATYFRDMMKTMKSDIDVARSLPLLDGIDTIEKIQDTLDDIWRQKYFANYPQARMVNLLEVIAKEIVDIVKATLRKANVIKESFVKIFTFRSNYDTFLSLLAPDEQKETHVGNSFSPFQTLDVLECTQEQFELAVLQHNKFLAKAEVIVAGKLSQILTSVQSQPHQMLQEFQKYSEIIKRDVIHKRLDILLSQISNEIQTIQTRFKEKRSLAKVDEAKTAVSVLSPSDPNFNQTFTEMTSSIKKFEKENFEAWVIAISDSLEDESLRVRFQSGRLMELNVNDGRLLVNFDESLIVLIREVRQLLSLGLSIPQKLLQATETAKKFYRYGVILKQVAHFYNNIHEQMLPCQHTMMLEAAKSFERLVKEPLSKNDASLKPKKGTMTAEGFNEVEDYIQRLQNSAGFLTSENRRLRKYHTLICDIEGMNTIRNLIAAAQEGGIKTEDTLIWRNHWDCQLYKALEFQYRVSLENLNENLPEIKVDLIFQQQKLQFRPAFENIRASYYREMKSIINIPSSFRGLGETKIFQYMVDRNSDSLAVVYRKTDQLFQNLLGVYETFKDWVLLGTIGLESFVEEALSDVSDWELNFRMLKSKGKEAELIPPSIKIDCITISTAPVKAAIDDHLQRLFDCLLNALKAAIQSHLSIIENFVNQGTDILAQRPQTLAEISEANIKHDELAAGKASIAHHFDGADQKNKLLKSVAGNGVDISKTQMKWSKLELMLEGHEIVIKEKVEILRGAIDGRKQGLANDVGKFASRWTQLKPQIAELNQNGYVARAITSLKDRRSELEELFSTLEQLIVDCHHFGMQEPDDSALRDLSKELTMHEDMWALLAEYQASIEKTLAEDWLSLRSKAHLFEDLLIEWLDRVRSRPVDAVSAYLQNEIDSLREIFPYLKFLRGESWMSEHWGELFRLLEIPKGIGLPDLTLNHIFKAKKLILAKLNEIKELNSRANGEVAIREALQELDMWGASAVFALSDYEDVKGETLKIIKDWKDTINQVGDNQSLLQSLKDSPYYKSFTDKARLWEQKLADLDEILRNLNGVQRKWVYLEPIFNRGALPSEQARFSRIDDDFRNICKFISKDNRMVSIVSLSGVRETLNVLTDQLERCQKALNEFLEEKRSKFARFYFIGDEDLLEILGQAQNPNVIQTHLKKLFAGVHQVEFDQDMKSIIAMRSLEGEEVA